jgi:hypothetical protein
VAAYAKALGEMTGTPVNEVRAHLLALIFLQCRRGGDRHQQLLRRGVWQGWVVRLDKTQPKWQAMKVANLDETFDDFLGALRLWRGLKADPYIKLSSS